MKIRLYGLAFAAAALLVAATTAFGEPSPGRAGRPQSPVRGPATPTRGERDQATQVRSQNRRFDVNNLNMFVTNYGSIARDIENNGNSGLFFPNRTTKTAVYASGLWLGGKVRGSSPVEIRACAGEYASEYQPGTILSPGVADNPSNPAYTTYKVVRYTGNPADTAHLERSAALVVADRTLDPLIHHSWSEYVNGAAPYGAPTRTYRFPGVTNPADSVDVIGPDMLGDQMVWAVYNDEFLSPREVLHSLPMGVEVQQKIFGFDRQGALGNTVFLDYNVINKSARSYDSCYVLLWSDPDLGGAGDDLVGCDIPLSVGYVYNATNTDQLYGDRPPAVGYDFFKGPSVGATNLGLTSFIFYVNGTDPGTPVEGYNYMRGFNRDGTPILDDNDQPTKFQFPGDPVRGTGWLDSNPGDRRFMCISGPFTLAAGDTQRIVGAIVIAQGGDRLTSVTGMKFFDIKAQTAFDRDFRLPPPPPQPRVTASTNHGHVNLVWDAGSRFAYTPDPGYEFEGYNVYQGASISGPWKRLATFDVVNGIQAVRDTVFDVATGLIINDTPTAFGGDIGVEYTYGLDQDQIKGGKLRDGTTYFYAVTAYAVNPSPPMGLEKVLETSFQPIAVTVQRPASGTDVGAVLVNASVVHRVDTGIPPTTDHVIVDVVDAASITGHTYAITYNSPSTNARGVPVTTWNLLDLTTGRTLLSNRTERTDQPSYAPVDGMVVKLRESQAADTANSVNDIFYAPFDAEMPFAAVDGAGLNYFGGGFGYAWDFFNGYDYTTVPADSFPNVELRFGQTQLGYIFYRDEVVDTGDPPSGGRGYTYGGIGTLPFQAWNTTDNVQINAAFVERRVTDESGVPIASQPASHDGRWFPTTSTSDGGREYLFINKRAYSTTPIPEIATDASIFEEDHWIYAAWLRSTGTPKAGEKFYINADGNRPGTSNDTLIITTRKAPTNLTSLQKSRLDNIRVVPNPYYSRSSYELSSFNRIVKFMNMPESATVRIYNLAGHLVRTLRKTDASSSILEWNLENENRLPIASGVYVYSIDVPGAGTETGRLVVFMEKERLQNF